MASEDIDMIVVEMLVSSGNDGDSQWFDYRPSFFGDVVRIEWEHDTMEAALEKSAAEYLIKHGYAKRVSPEQEPEPLVVLKKEELIVVETVVPLPSTPPRDMPTTPRDTQSAPPPSSPPPTEAPHAEAIESTASSGGKQKKKEKQK